MLERGMAVAVTGSPLSSFDGSGGSNAMAATLDKVSLRLTRADAKALALTLYKWLIVPFVVANYGDAALAPQYKPTIREPEDLKVAAETIKTLVDAGTRIPASYVYDKFSIPSPDDGEEVLGQMQRNLANRRLRLASGDSPTQASGFVDGAFYADGLAETGVRRAAAIMEGDLERVLEAVAAAPDYPTLRRTLIELYKDLDSTALAELMQRSLLMASLGGRAAVQDDL
jgi:phage gp29-like protein